MDDPSVCRIKSLHSASATYDVGSSFRLRYDVVVPTTDWARFNDSIVPYHTWHVLRYTTCLNWSLTKPLETPLMETCAAAKSSGWSFSKNDNRSRCRLPIGFIFFLLAFQLGGKCVQRRLERTSDARFCIRSSSAPPSQKISSRSLSMEYI